MIATEKLAPAATARTLRSSKNEMGSGAGADDASDGHASRSAPSRPSAESRAAPHAYAPTAAPTEQSVVSSVADVVAGSERRPGGAALVAQVERRRHRHRRGAVARVGVGDGGSEHDELELRLGDPAPFRRGVQRAAPRQPGGEGVAVDRPVERDAAVVGRLRKRQPERVAEPEGRVDALRVESVSERSDGPSLVPHAPESAGAQPAAASDVPAALRTRAPASTQHVQRADAGVDVVAQQLGRRVRRVDDLQAQIRRVDPVALHPIAEGERATHRRVERRTGEDAAAARPRAAGRHAHVGRPVEGERDRVLVA